MNCNSNFINPSTSCNNSEGMVKMLILAKEGVEIATGTLAETKATWDTLIQAKDIIPLPVAISTEPQNEGAVYEQTPLGSMWVRDGRKEMKFNINTNMDLHSKLRSLNGSEYVKMFIVYNSGVIVGTQDAGSEIIKPFALQLLHVEYHMDNDGSVGGKTPIMVSFEDATEFEDKPVFVKPSAFNPLRLNALKNVKMDLVSASATSIVVDAYIPHILNGYKNPVEGLVVADFILTTTAGALQTIGGIAEDENLPGRYTISGTGLVSGFINLKLASLMTTKGFDSVGAATVTI